MNRKAKIFIGSSTESLPVAEAINVNLDHEMEVTIWRNGFDLSQNSLDSIINKADATDFALFVFSPDDIALIRQQEKQIVRDNVLFELGLFIGAIGKNRCFILKPRGEELHFPSDLAGLTYADYEANRSDNDLVSAVNASCTLIKHNVSKIGNRNYLNSTKHEIQKPIILNDTLNDTDARVLLELLTTYTEAPTGYSVYQIKKNMKNNETTIDLSIIKLLKLNYIDRSIEEDNSYPFYSYSITETGIDIAMNFSLNTNDLNVSSDEIPF